MPQASRRSVFTSEALSAARTCRVSMSTVSRPCRDRPVCNHSGHRAVKNVLEYDRGRPGGARARSGRADGGRLPP